MGSKLRFVFRNFSLTRVCPHAYQAALAVEAAAAQGQFWEMYTFYSDMDRFLTDNNLRESAAKLGLNAGKFDREFLEGNYSRHLDEDTRSGGASGVTKTPTFFITGDL